MTPGAHSHVERHEKTVELPHLSPLAKRIAVTVAILAAFLAVAEVFAENRIAKVITYETKISHINTVIETDEVLAALGKPEPGEAALKAKVAVLEKKQASASDAHHNLELAIVLLQIGIVLSSITALIGVEWLLRLGTLLGVAGVVFLVLGLLA